MAEAETVPELELVSEGEVLPDTLTVSLAVAEGEVEAVEDPDAVQVALGEALGVSEGEVLALAVALPLADSVWDSVSVTEALAEREMEAVTLGDVDGDAPRDSVAEGVLLKVGVALEDDDPETLPD